MSQVINITKEQQNIIDSDLLKKVVISGPGTGKTTIIIYLLDKLKKSGANLSKVQVLTFTKSNTSDFIRKINKNIQGDNKPRVNNIHSFALRELCKNNSSLENIADDADEILIRQDLKNLLNIKLDRVKELFKKLFAGWENLNAEKKEWESTFSPDAPAFLGVLREQQKIMSYVLRGELVYLYKSFLDQNVEYKPDIEYLIVDEYQDFNPCDQRVIKLIAERSQCQAFLSGDDDQSIYSFRNADPEGIKIDFLKKNYNDIEEFKLSECFRCDKNILDISQSVISQDYNRIPKVLKPQSTNAGIVKLYRFNNQDEEAEKIAKLSDFLINKKGFKPQDILILLRNDFRRAFSKPIVEQHIKLALPVKCNDLESSFKTEFGQYLLAYIKLIVDKNKSLAIRTILEYTKGVGKETYKKAYKYAKENRCNFFDALNQVNNNLVKDIVDKISSIKENWEEKEIKEQLDLIIEIIPDYIKDGKDDVISDLNEILELYDKKLSLDNFLSIIHGLIEDKEAVIDQSSINIMTMHKAKGLSSKVVIIPALDDEIYNADCDDEEERRLLYVSLTRAKNVLILSFCKTRSGQQAFSGSGQKLGKARSISRFLKDIIAPLNIKIENGSMLFTKQ
jgi:DNA helicase II / ATP-dependent DNA helicase PcrA